MADSPLGLNTTITPATGYDAQQDESRQNRAVIAPATSPSTGRKRGFSNATAEVVASATGRIRAASEKVLDANVPSGMWSATGSVVAKAPTPAEIRRNSYGSRKGSDTSIPKVRSDSQSSAQGMTEELETRGGRSASSPKKLDDIADEDDGFPTNIFGREEIPDQSYVRGQRGSVISQRIPKLAVRSNGSGSEQATTTQQGDTGVPTTTPAVSSTTALTNQPQSTEPFPDLDDDSDLDELDPRPQRKRQSKNIDAMLGRSQPELAAADRVSSETGEKAKPVPNDEGVYPNGYSFPKPKPWTEATAIGFKAFLRWTFTPFGFLIVLYGANVVAWGGMLFLLLCNASPAMCRLGDGREDCNDIDSPRRVWVEIDSQVVNALFCVTGFGLIPWRFRDWYFWFVWRVQKKEFGLRKLAGYHNGWFRLPHSDELPVKDFRESDQSQDVDNSALPLPLKKTAGPPLTGARAPPTPLWHMDLVVWAFVWNTFLQAVLSGFMWGLNRYDRPSWSTGLFVALACIVAAVGGIYQFIDGKAIKKVEGVPIEVEKEYRDIEQGEKAKSKAAPAVVDKR